MAGRCRCGSLASYEIYPGSPWNYALVINAPLTIQKKAWPTDNNPFTPDNVPLEVKTFGRRVPGWEVDEYGLCGVLPYENATKATEKEQITLIPMGAARLRITAFPTADM